MNKLSSSHTSSIAGVNMVRKTRDNILDNIYIHQNLFKLEIGLVQASYTSIGEINALTSPFIVLPH